MIPGSSYGELCLLIYRFALTCQRETIIHHSALNLQSFYQERAREEGICRVVSGGMMIYHLVFPGERETINHLPPL
jgi:hypothetical protein